MRSHLLFRGPRKTLTSDRSWAILWLLDWMAEKPLIRAVLASLLPCETLVQSPALPNIQTQRGRKAWCKDGSWPADPLDTLGHPSRPQSHPAPASHTSVTPLLTPSPKSKQLAQPGALTRRANPFGFTCSLPWTCPPPPLRSSLSSTPPSCVSACRPAQPLKKPPPLHLENYPSSGPRDTSPLARTPCPSQPGLDAPPEFSGLHKSPFTLSLCTNPA